MDTSPFELYLDRPVGTVRPTRHIIRRIPMTIISGTRLGPYEILAAIGAGGMGEVYRARDPRLGRDVAIKVLPASFSADADRLRRFEQEARAAGILNHPNITAVLDIGEHEGAPYVVQELLEGETLRQALAGGLSPRKAIDHAIQIAHGLAAAHEKGIVHRDLKPENVFVTKDGRLKILDFGLAKLTHLEEGSQATNLPTATAGTEPGMVLGTLGYMSPEQVRGRPADARSDIFSFGAILYEMLAGQRAFKGDSAADTMSAILKEDPPDLSVTNQNVAPGVERIVRHCLEKNPEQRFQSARDLAFDLEALSGVSAPGRAAAGPMEPSRARRRLFPIAAAVLALAAVLAGGYFLGTRRSSAPPPAFRQLTFRRGAIWRGRFGSDGKSVLYSASWNGKPTEIYVSHPESPESRPFGVAATDLLAVSPAGEVAVSVNADFDTAFTRRGTLARVGATGGAPREVLEKVQFADWSADGRDLAIVRRVDRRTRLEFPAGKVLYETPGWISHPRFSHEGDRIAFLDHPEINDDGGSAAIVDLAGKKTSISGVYASAYGLAWSPDGRDVWFTAAEVGGNRSLYAATPSGHNRVLASITGSLTLHDVSRDGRVLVSQDLNHIGVIAGSDPSTEVDLTWLDWSLLADLTPDGKAILFSEAGEGGGAGYSAYLRRTDGAAAVRLGEGSAQALSPDGKQILAIVHPTADRQLVTYPTGAGESKKVSPPGFEVSGAAWTPDGSRILMNARETGRELRTYVIEAGGKPRPFLPDGYRALNVSQDGRRVIARGPEDRYYVCNLEGGTPAAIPGLTQDADSIVGWGPEDQSIFVRRGRGTSLPAKVVRLDPASGREEKWRDILPADAAGLNSINSIRMTRDGKHYAYSYYRSLSNLYVANGLR
jgi:eukaryotic-like serine/threonine-protein kinase